MLASSVRKGAEVYMPLFWGSLRAAGWLIRGFCHQVLLGIALDFGACVSSDFGNSYATR